MPWKLVSDSVRRLRSPYLMASALISLIWMAAAGADGPSMGTALACSMACGFMAGPLLGFAALNQREVIYPPLSRRQVWRARWVTVLIVPVALLLAAKAIALVVARVCWTG